jgi:hypothetical protein
LLHPFVGHLNGFDSIRDEPGRESVVEACGAPGYGEGEGTREGTGVFEVVHGAELLKSRAGGMQLELSLDVLLMGGTTFGTSEGKSPYAVEGRLD